MTEGRLPATPTTPADLLEMHRRMLVIRGFEQRVSKLYRSGEVPGFVHLSIGQEASAVGACWPLHRADVIFINASGPTLEIWSSISPDVGYAIPHTAAALERVF